jgi:hypothetical protein
MLRAVVQTVLAVFVSVMMFAAMPMLFPFALLTVAFIIYAPVILAAAAQRPAPEGEVDDTG